MGNIGIPPHPDFTAIRWHLKPDEPLEELDAIDLADCRNPLAPCLVAALHTTQRLSSRLGASSEVIRAALGVIHDQQRQIATLQQQNRRLLEERRHTP